MPQAERWLAATWPTVRDALPEPPARVVELGCGTLGGHVPMLRAAGYDAIGVDPEAPDGRVIVIEWDWEAFDQPTAEWCFRRLGPKDDAGWLHHHRDAWAASQGPWDDYLRSWAQEHRIHPARELLALLGERFRLDPPVWAPYFFADLDEASEEDEATAIAAGEIRATRVEVVGRRG